VFTQISAAIVVASSTAALPVSVRMYAHADAAVVRSRSLLPNKGALNPRNIEPPTVVSSCLSPWHEPVGGGSPSRWADRAAANVCRGVTNRVPAAWIPADRDEAAEVLRGFGRLAGWAAEAGTMSAVRGRRRAGILPRAPLEIAEPRTPVPEDQPAAPAAALRAFIASA
jgi:hypothetical protein